MNKNTLVNLLKTETVTVAFTKADGSLRTMNATLVGEEVNADLTSNEAISVIDTDLGAYRSFRFDTVKSVNGQSVTL